MELLLSMECYWAICTNDYSICRQNMQVTQDAAEGGSPHIKRRRFGNFFPKMTACAASTTVHTAMQQLVPFYNPFACNGTRENQMCAWVPFWHPMWGEKRRWCRLKYRLFSDSWRLAPQCGHWGKNTDFLHSRCYTNGQKEGKTLRSLKRMPMCPVRIPTSSAWFDLQIARMR